MGTEQIAGSSALPLSAAGEQRYQTGVETGQSQGAPLLSNKALTTSPCPPPPLPLQTHRLPLRLGLLWVFPLLSVALGPHSPRESPDGQGASGGAESRAGTVRAG